MIFFVVPEIMLAVMWPTFPARDRAERTGAFGAFGSIRAPTKSVRWYVLGILLLALAVYPSAPIAFGVASIAGDGSLGALAGEGQVRIPVPTQPSYRPVAAIDRRDGRADLVYDGRRITLP